MNEWLRWAENEVARLRCITEVEGCETYHEWRTADEQKTMLERAITYTKQNYYTERKEEKR